MPHITTILFDCDNTLVKSEEIAFQACAIIANDLLADNGVTTKYTGPDLQRDFVGQNFRGMLHGLVARHSLTVSEETIETGVQSELAMVIDRLEKTPVQVCDGVVEALDRLGQGRYELAVVSSSALPRVEASLKVTDLASHFGDRVYSAATSLPVPTSKPQPDIYIHSCRELGKSASECVAVEDSQSGAKAAVAAGIPLIGYVGTYEDPEEKKEITAALKKIGAIVIMDHWDEFASCLEAVESAPAPKI